uniref:tRNA-splicing endonuclease subunit Sen15 domain-containing protein n=1 Tax=Sinocyclocheilus grahami TaxID=75366 RepID=A0A672T3D3_SINGR
MDEVNRADPPSWIQQHAYQDLMHLDVGDSAQVYAAFLVYMDLTEVRKWKEVVGVSCPELQAVLLEGREKEGETVQMVYPLPSHRSIKHRDFYLLSIKYTVLYFWGFFLSHFQILFFIQLVLKGSYDAAKKNIILCIWCNEMWEKKNNRKLKNTWISESCIKSILKG